MVPSMINHIDIFTWNSRERDLPLSHLEQLSHTTKNHGLKGGKVFEVNVSQYFFTIICFNTKMILLVKKNLFEKQLLSRSSLTLQAALEWFSNM